jgi:hypothetical protein
MLPLAIWNVRRRQKDVLRIKRLAGLARRFKVSSADETL